MFELLKDINHRNTLKKLGKMPRRKQIANWKEVETIGIVFEMGSEADWNVIMEFCGEMKKQGKMVNLIGLQPKKLEMSYIIAMERTLICREKEDTNLWGNPKDKVIADFVDKNYDVLIDMTRYPNYFGQYISLRGKAKLKIVQIDKLVEKSDAVATAYDMIIESEGEMKAKDYLSQVVNYLSMIKK